MSPDTARCSRGEGGHSSPAESHCVTLSVRGPWLTISRCEFVVRDYLYVSQSSFPVLLFDKDLASISARSDMGMKYPSTSLPSFHLSSDPEPVPVTRARPEDAETCRTLRAQPLAWSMSTKSWRVRRGWVWKPSTNRWLPLRQLWKLN